MATIARESAAPNAPDIEATLRRDLAAAYRLCALFGWDDHIATHLSARLPDGSFLLNPFGLLFEEITASSLMRVSMDGRVLKPEDATMNPAAFTIHSGVLEGRPDVGCVMHLHTRDGAAVSATKDGLLPLTQTALLVHSDLAYHDFEGVADDLSERESLQRDLGDKNCMILRNHGTLTVGRSVAAAFFRMYSLEWACAAQVRAASLAGSCGGLAFPSPEALATTERQAAQMGTSETLERVFWGAMLRKAERDCAGFET